MTEPTLEMQRAGAKALKANLNTSLLTCAARVWKAMEAAIGPVAEPMPLPFAEAFQELVRAYDHLPPEELVAAVAEWLAGMAQDYG